VRRSPRSAQGPQAGFDRIVPARLARARETADVRWSLLDIRLDDPDDLRRAFGGERFERVASRFADAVTASLPADADVRRDSPTSFTVLVPRRREALRQLAADLLERVSRVDESRPMPVRISASIGWAETEVLGHDLDDLCAAAAAANLEARNLGGDRWARASPPETAL
jgi:GGDEF domain-containing protein